MKKNIFLSFLLVFCISCIYGQNTYDISKNNGKTINLNNSTNNCKVVFTGDNCKPDYQSGYYNYCDGENYKITFNAGASKRINFTFSSNVMIDQNTNQPYGNDYYIYPGDTIYFYDGPSTSSPLMHKYTGSTQGVYDAYYNVVYGIGMVSPVNSSDSCITIVFKSNSDGKTAPGWAADVICQDKPLPPRGCNGNNPASNFIAEAPSICNLNGYCGSTSSYYTVDLPPGLCEMCNLFNGGLQNNSWLSFVADSTTATLNVSVSNCTQNQGIQFAVYSKTDNNFKLLSDIGYTSGDPSYNNAGKTLSVTVPSGSAPSLVKGQKYYIMVDGLAGDVCNYSITAKTGVAIQASAGSDQTICNGSVATLSATGGKTYSWSPSKGLSNAAINNPQASPTTTTTYIVTISGTGINTDCPFSGKDTVIVNVKPGPVIDAGRDTSLCYGNTINLSVSAPAGSSYTWSNGNNTSSISVSPVQTSTYKITVGGQNGCFSKDSVKVSVNSNPVVYAGPNQTIISGKSATLTATGGIMYIWSSYENTAAITVSPTVTTTYKVTAITLNGCSGTSSVIVFVNQPACDLTVNAGSDVTTCIGSGARLLASGADSYKWSSGGTTAMILVNPSLTTTYTVTGTKGSCTASDAVVVSLITTPVVSAGNNVAICSGASTTLTATGASNYVWSTADVNAKITVMPSVTTTYIVTGTVGVCSVTSSVIVTVNNLPQANAGADVTVSKGSSTNLTATGGATYTWSTTATTASITVSPTVNTTYIVTVKNSAGCSATDNVVVIVVETCSASAGSNVTICSGSSTTLVASGGDAYKWSNQVTTASNTVSPTANTTYTVTATKGTCTSSASVTVTITAVPQANAGADATVSKGSLTTLTATGGATYTWSTTATTASITVSPTVSTTYIVTVKNSAGCSATDNVIVTVVETCSANAGSNVTICSGSSTTLVATGGDSYKWSNQVTTASNTVSPTANTTYTVTATKGTCTSSASVTVTITAAPQVNAGNDVTTCIGSGARLLATGGDSYKWSSGGTTAMISVNPTITTTYIVTGTKGSCTASDAVVVSLINTPVVSAGNNVAICSGASTTLTATGASNYVWSTADIKATITVTPSITTTYIVTGTVGVCSVTSSVIVTVNNLPVANAGNDVTTCIGSGARLLATGGDSYKWSTGGTTAMISVNPTVTTTYIVTATKGSCTASDAVVVSLINTPVVSAGTDVAICNGATTNLTATGAVSYSWSTGSTTTSTTVNPASTTTYIVTGAVGVCSVTSSVVVTVNNLAVSAGNDVTVCAGSGTRLLASGGDSYKWSTGATTTMISVNPATNTTYTLTATAGQCAATAMVVVTIGNITVNAGQDKNICSGTTTNLNAIGGGLTFKWSTGETTSTINVSPTITTIYLVTAISGNCYATDEVVVNVYPALTLNAGVDRTINSGSSVILTATGASNYSWSTGGTTASISVNPTLTTTYVVTGSNAACSTTDNIIVTVNSLPVASAGQNITICRLDTPRLTATGGIYYKWSTGSRLASISVNPTVTTTYTVTVTSSTGATSKAQVVVYVVISNAYAGVDRTICFGNSVTLTATGGQTYKWSTGAVTPSITVTPNVMKLYIVTASVAAQRTCTSSDVVVVRVNKVAASAGPNVLICKGLSTTLTANGGVKYVWNTSATTQSIVVNPTVTSTYTVSVTSAQSCSASAKVIVTVTSCKNNEEVTSNQTSHINSRTEMFSIYPNPFNEETVVSYSLKESSTVEISMYDLLGNAISTIDKGQRNAGSYNFNLKRNSLSPGVYFIEFRIDENRSVKKVVLM